MSNTEQREPGWREVFKPPFTFDREGWQINDSNGTLVLNVRGWSHLVGIAALNMVPEEAAKIMDAFGEEVTKSLNATLSRGQSSIEQGWVSVKERLPEGHGRYLVCCREKIGVTIAEYFHRWVGRGIEKPDAALTVTHWQPLPKSPAT